MRNLIVPLLFVAIGAAQAQARLDASEAEPRIVVTVTKTARIVPDRATVYILIEGSGETPPDAAQRAGQKLQSVSNAIRQSGVAIDAATPLPYGITLAPNMNGYPGASAQPSYIARFAIRVQLSKLDQLLPLTAAAIGAGAASSSGPFFEASTLDSARRARYAEALATARGDAEALASALGGRLGALIEVTTTGVAGPGFSSPYINFSRFESGGQTQAPEVQASATVTVRYRFLPK